MLLTVQEIAGKLPKWTIVPEEEQKASDKDIMGAERARSIARTFEFEDFVHAWSFMSAVALRAEKMDHHPDWSNVYNRVAVVLNTHDVGGLVTEKDIQLAAIMDSLYHQ
jgi:4a-hydroxytetrahydrobiopterin dehydratase